MKIAVLSDIHGNLPALQVVLEHLDAWQPDEVIVNGDIVNRGPRSRDCWQMIEARFEQAGWRGTIGNHEEYVLAWEEDRQLSDVEAELYQSSYWTYQQLAGAVTGLKKMQALVTLSGPDGREVCATHASMRGTRDGIYLSTAAAEMRHQIAPAPPLFITSHTHHFFTLQLDHTLIVNSGSVGCPLDGDTRTGYAQLEWRSGGWQTHLVRLPYAREQVDGEFHTSGYLTEGGVVATLLYAEWRQAQPHAGWWARQYQRQVLAGEISPAESVRRYLRHAGLEAVQTWR